MKSKKAPNHRSTPGYRQVGCVLSAIVILAVAIQVFWTGSHGIFALPPLTIAGYLILSMVLVWQPEHFGFRYALQISQITMVALVLHDMAGSVFGVRILGASNHEGSWQNVYFGPAGFGHAVSTLGLAALHAALIARGMRCGAHALLIFVCWGFAILALYHLVFGMLLEGRVNDVAPILALWLATLGVTLTARNGRLFSSLWAGDESGRLLRMLLLAVLLFPLGLGVFFAIKVDLMVRYTLELELVFGSIACLLVPLVVWLGSVLQDRQALLLRLAHIDPLTGALNRAGLEARLDEDHKGLILFDLDHFKRLNDTFGHNEGDRVLQKVASAVSENLSDADVLARWGGEEFLILSREGTPEAVRALAETTRSTVAALPPLRQKNRTLGLTVSIGYGTLDSDGGDFKTRLTKVDHALYIAKSLGRNRSVCADDALDHIPVNPELLKLCARCDRFDPARETA